MQCGKQLQMFHRNKLSSSSGQNWTKLKTIRLKTDKWGMSHRQQEDRPIRASYQTKEISPWAGQREWRTEG